MALQERRWRRRQPTVREVDTAVSYGGYGPYLAYDYFEVNEGDDIEINTGALGLGTVRVVRKPDFLREDGTFLVGRVPLVSEVEADEFDIELETAEGFLSAPVPVIRDFDISARAAMFDALSEYPFVINLRSYLHGLPSDAIVNIASIAEYGVSTFETNFENALDANLNFTYAPRGNFLRNIIQLNLEITDPRRRGTGRVTQAASFYGGPGSPSEPPVNLPPIRTAPPEMATVTVQLCQNLATDASEQLSDFWNYQGHNGTCLIASVGSVLESLGVASFEEVLRRTTVGVDKDGNYVVLDRDGDPVYKDDGTYLYLSEATDQSLVDIFIDGKPTYVKVLETLSAEYLEFFTENLGLSVEQVMDGLTMPNPDNPQDWSWTETMFSEFGVESHTGYMSNFATLIAELNAGNKVVAYVDAVELWRSPLTDAIVNSGWVPLAFGRSVENHMLWITGVDLSDPDEPIIILNDSGQEDGAGVRYPLERFLNAFEDSEFEYTATGFSAPDNELQVDRAGLMTEICAYQADLIGTSSGLLSDVARDNFNKEFNELMEDRAFLERVDDFIPGFRERARNYKRNVNVQQQNVLRAMGLTSEQIARINQIYADVDEE